MGFDILALAQAIGERLSGVDLKLWDSRCLSYILAFVVYGVLRDMGFDVETVEPGVILRPAGAPPILVKYIQRLTTRNVWSLKAGAQVLSEGGLMVLLLKEGVDLLDRFGEVYVKPVSEHKLCIVGLHLNIPDMTTTPGLLVFEGSPVSSSEILEAARKEGAELNKLLKKREDAIKVLGARGVGVISNSDIAYRRLRLADLGGGFADFVEEIDRLRQDGIWDDGVKELVKSMLRKYISLGVPQQVVEQEASRRGIDIYA